MTERFSTRQWVPFPVELVFAFFANPANLPLLVPVRMRARIESVHFRAPPARPPFAEAKQCYLSIAAGEGSEIRITFCPIPGVPWRIGWIARITEFLWNSHFCDEQIDGPFAVFRHRHEIQAKSKDAIEGTTVSDEIEFALPLGPLGKAAAPFVRHQLKRAFAYRQALLPQRLEDAAARAELRASRVNVSSSE